MKICYLKNFPNIFHLWACPTKAREALIEPKSWISEALKFLAHKIELALVPDFGAVSNGDDDFCIWRSVVQLFPVHVAGKVLIG